MSPDGCQTGHHCQSRPCQSRRNALRAASAPQTALPNAMPPCSTSRYIESARARIHDGHMVCATTLKHARMPIQAAPAVNNTRQSHSKTWTLPGQESHRRENHRCPGDQAVHRISQPQPRQQCCSRQRAQPETGQQESVSLGAMRLADHRQQREQGSRTEAECAGADQH